MMHNLNIDKKERLERKSLWLFINAARSLKKSRCLPISVGNWNSLRFKRRSSYIVRFESRGRPSPFQSSCFFAPLLSFPISLLRPSPFQSSFFAPEPLQLGFMSSTLSSLFFYRLASSPLSLVQEARLGPVLRPKAKSRKARCCFQAGVLASLTKRVRERFVTNLV